MSCCHYQACHSAVSRITWFTLLTLALATPSHSGKMTAGKDAAGVDYSELDQKSLLEMKNQAKLWDRIDSKMEDKIKSLKATGGVRVVVMYLL
jgi:hypothetical protein